MRLLELYESYFVFNDEPNLSFELVLCWQVLNRNWVLNVVGANVAGLDGSIVRGQDCARQVVNEISSCLNQT